MTCITLGHAYLLGHADEKEEKQVVLSIYDHTRVYFLVLHTWVQSIILTL